jgi:hypothetical protein
MRKLLIVTIIFVIPRASDAAADPTTFHAEQYVCELTIDGEAKGRIYPDQPFTIDLPRGHEYVVECESHDIPSKLYARNYVFSRGDFRSGPLPADVTVAPVAVLPNVVRAAVAGELEVTAVVNTTSVICQGKSKDQRNLSSKDSHLITPQEPQEIPKGAVVQLSGAPWMHCGDTNLIEVIVGGSKAWFRNRDFVFSYKGKAIPLFDLSQDLACCWRD